MKYIVLLIIIGIKILATELCCIGLILLSFLIKSKMLAHNNQNHMDWNLYFANMTDHFVIQWRIGIYLISSTVATFIAYILFQVFDFQTPFAYASMLFVFSAVMTWLQYRRKEKMEIVEKLSFLRQVAKEDLEPTDVK